LKQSQTISRGWCLCRLSVLTHPHRTSQMSQYTSHVIRIHTPRTATTGNCQLTPPLTPNLRSTIPPVGKNGRVGLDTRKRKEREDKQKGNGGRGKQDERMAASCLHSSTHCAPPRRYSSHRATSACYSAGAQTSAMRIRRPGLASADVDESSPSASPFRPPRLRSESGE